MFFFREVLSNASQIRYIYMTSPNNYILNLKYDPTYFYNLQLSDIFAKIIFHLQNSIINFEFQINPARHLDVYLDLVVNNVIPQAGEMSNSSCLTDCSVLNQTTCQPVSRRQMVLDNVSFLHFTSLTPDIKSSHDKTLFSPSCQSHRILAMATHSLKSSDK